jgi:hypothetical protein
MVIVSLDSPSCEVPCWILLSVVYQDVTRQAKGLHRLKHVGALERGLAYLSRCNSGWFCHNQDLKERHCWYGMKRDVAAHVALCDVCQRVKAEHQRLAGLLQPLRVDF